MRKLEIAANCFVIILAVLLSGALFKTYYFPTTPPLSGHVAAVDFGHVQLDLPGVQWNRAPSSILLVLSIGCHFCSASTPFYKRLVAELRTSHGRSRVVAVFPQDREMARGYLRTEGIVVDDVLSIPLNQVMVQGTPTILLVDERGRIVNGWVGKLDAGGEHEVLTAIKRFS
jgi:hypothetical protein